MREFLPVLKAWTLYFGAEVRGWENLPAAGPYLVIGNHSGGAETNDAAFFMARWIEEKGPEAPIYGLAYDLLFAYPVVGKLFPKLGMLPASAENARKALAQDAVVLDFPGGDYEVFRPWTHRNKIEFGGRKGFIKIALETGVPVVPMTIHGAHQSTFVLTRGRELAHRLGLERLRIKVFPLIWNIPFGLTPAYVPSLQLPAKVTVQLGKPLDWSRSRPREFRRPARPRTLLQRDHGRDAANPRRAGARASAPGAHAAQRVPSHQCVATDPEKAEGRLDRTQVCLPLQRWRAARDA